MPLDSQQLRTLSSILRNGSFEAAAQELGITQSAVSQRLKALEESAGTLLVKRESPCTGTAAGRRLAAHADQIAALEQSVTDELLPNQVGRTKPISIAINADSLATWFMESFEDIDDFTVTFVIDNQNFSDELLRKGEVVGAVTANGAPIAGCDCYPLGAIQYAPTATPEYIEKHFPNGVTIEALRGAPMLRFNAKDTVQHQWIRQFFGRDCHPPCHSIPATDGFLNANLAGLGWGMNPLDSIAHHLQSGRLKSILPNAEISIMHYWQTSRFMKPALAKLTEAIRQTARKTLPHS